MENVRIFAINIIEKNTGNIINTINYKITIADNVNKYFDFLKELVEEESNNRLTIKLKELSICDNMFNILRNLGIKGNVYLLDNPVIE